MSYATEVLADSPRIYFKCEDGSGNPQDDSGSDRDATSTLGSGIGYQTPGAVGFGINLPGTAGWYRDDEAALDLGDVVTMECWFKATALGVTHGLISKLAGAYYMRIDGTANKLQLLASQTAMIVESTTSLSDTTTFHHYAATKTGATCKLYIDGVDRTGSVSNTTLVDNIQPLLIGSDDFALGSEVANGVIDEVAVYATALSSARVLAHFNAAGGVGGSGGRGATMTLLGVG